MIQTCWVPEIIYEGELFWATLVETAFKLRGPFLYYLKQKKTMVTEFSKLQKKNLTWKPIDKEGVQLII